MKPKGNENLPYVRDINKMKREKAGKVKQNTLPKRKGEHMGKEM